MGFLGTLFGKKDEEAAVELSSAVTQQPEYEEKLQTIDMSKHNENLGKVLIDMSKGSKIDMTKHTARVALAMDYSGSMDWLYDNGSVQETISRLLPIALRFDDNGELVFGESHILCNLFNIDAIERMGNKPLPYHTAFKKATYIDKDGNKVVPTSPNAFKFEAFLFDAFGEVDDMAILRVKREEEFAPVKNASGVDSPETARKLYNDFHKK